MTSFFLKHKKSCDSKILIDRVCIYIYLSLRLSDTHVRMLEDCVLETIQEQNKLAAGSDRSVLMALSAGVTFILTQLAGLYSYYYIYFTVQTDADSAVWACAGPHLPAGWWHSGLGSAKERGSISLCISAKCKLISIGIYIMRYLKKKKFYREFWALNQKLHNWWQHYNFYETKYFKKIRIKQNNSKKKYQFLIPSSTFKAFCFHAFKLYLPLCVIFQVQY